MLKLATMFISGLPGYVPGAHQQNSQLPQQSAPYQPAHGHVAMAPQPAYAPISYAPYPTHAHAPPGYMPHAVQMPQSLAAAAPGGVPMVPMYAAASQPVLQQYHPQLTMQAPMMQVQYHPQLPMQAPMMAPMLHPTYPAAASQLPG